MKIPISIKYVDHIVFTASNIKKTLEFYEQALNLKPVFFGKNNERIALSIGGFQKINLHEHKKEFEPHADKPTPGSQDICFVSDTPIQKIEEHLFKLGVKIEEGPVQRTGAMAKINSIYVRDPDNNLIEIANYDDEVPQVVIEPKSSESQKASTTENFFGFFEKRRNVFFMSTIGASAFTIGFLLGKK